MADYFQRFITPEVPALYERILAARDAAAARGLPRVAFDLDRLVVKLSGQMTDLAAETAAWTNARAIEILKAKQKRPDTDSSPHLADVIESDVVRGPLAEVGIADLAELAQARRRGRTTGGEYWRAQEFGLVEGFVGRQLHGVFQPSGTAPGPYDDDTGFEVTAAHGEGGWMRVKNPIEAKHFLTQATREGAARYVRGLNRITRGAEKDLLAITGRIAPAQPAAARGRRSPLLDYLLKNRR